MGGCAVRHDLYTLATQVKTRLTEQAAGVVVSYDGDTPTAHPGAALCIFSLDADAGDTFAPALTGSLVKTGDAAGDPVKRARALVAGGCKATISALSGKTGAVKHDHEGAALDARDKVICALYDMSIANRMPIDWTTATGRFVLPEGPGTNQLGARYELKFRVGAAIEETIGELAPTLTPSVTVKADRGDVAPETNCG